MVEHAQLLEVARKLARTKIPEVSISALQKELKVWETMERNTPVFLFLQETLGHVLAPHDLAIVVRTEIENYLRRHFEAL